MRHPHIPRPSVAARLRSERGVSLIFALVGLAALTILGLGLTSVGMMATKMTTNERDTPGRTRARRRRAVPREEADALLRVAVGEHDAVSRQR